MHTDRHLEDVNMNESIEGATKKPYHAPQLRALGGIKGLVQANGGGSNDDGDHSHYSNS